jgi:hypothetical protein
MYLALVLALRLAAPAAGGPAPVSEEKELAVAPALAGDRASRLRVAAEHRAARRYSEAASVYEGLYAERGEPGMLLEAARSRQAAGQYAHAVAYLSQLVASGQLTAADMQVAYGELQAAQRELTPVSVRVELPAGQGAASPRLTAEYLALTPREQRPPLGFPLPPGAVPVRVVILQLDPGAWRLQVDEPGLAAVDVLVDVTRQPGLEVRLDLRPPAEGAGLPLAQRRRLAAVLGGIGGVMLAVGAGLTASWELGPVRRTLARPSCDDRLACQRDHAVAVGVRSGGTGLLGAGAGALLGGLTGLVRDPRRRRSLWISELVLGGAGVVGGSFAVALAAHGFDEQNDAGRAWGDPEYVRTIDLRGDQHSIAAAGLGLGSGLAFASAAALVRTRRYHQRQRSQLGVTPSLARGSLGLTVSGRF